MRRFISLTTAALAASVWASAPAAAQNFKPEVLQKACSDMTFNQIGESLADLVQKYEFSSNPEEAQQQAIGLLCPSSAQTAQSEPSQDENAQEQSGEADAGAAQQANLVREASLPPQPHRPPPPQMRRPPPRHGVIPPPLVSIQRMPPPPPGGFGHRRPPPPRATASIRGHQERYHEEHYRSSRPRPLPLTSSARGERYCMADTDPERFARERPPPHAACEIGPIPGKPCPGWVCQRR